MATATATATTGTFLPANADPAALQTRSGVDRRAMAARANDAAKGFANPSLDYSGPFGPIKQMLNQPAVKKSLPLMVIAVVLLAFALVYTLINAPGYRPPCCGPWRQPAGTPHNGGE